jgi:protease I
MTTITDSRVLIIATHGFEQSELVVPRDKLREAGATVDVASPQSGEIRGWKGKDWGEPVKVDKTLDQVKVEDYDALVLPGGQINPDLLRVDEKAIGLIRQFVKSGRIVAAICHAPWLLVEVDAVRGRNVTSYHSIRTDVVNAGGRWVDREVVTDKGLITSRNPGDLDAFVGKIIEEIREGRHEKRRAVG